MDITSVESEDMIHACLETIVEDDAHLRELAERFEVTPDQFISWVERVKVKSDAVGL